ncbi:MAG: hypothetical protein L0323_04580 [Planctomycetes bacterium]|nr:hypothetical protein [Planctomycetota bacterium]
MRNKKTLAIGLAAALGAAAAPAQVASSPGFAASSVEIVAAAAGASSPGSGAPGRAAYGAIGSAAPGESASATVQAFSSLLDAFNPFGGSGPLVFRVNPAQGPTGGGTGIEIQGARFQPAGAAVFGPSGVATSATSPTRTYGMAPVSASAIQQGPVTLVVGDAGGTAVLPQGFRYLPAVLGSGGVIPGNDVLVRHYGPAGNAFVQALSFGSAPATPVPGLAGYLQLNVQFPFLIFLVVSNYGPDGTAPVQFPTPANPALSGTTFYWQSVVLPPTAPEFSNLATTSFL